METETDFDLLLNAERLKTEEVPAAGLRVLQDVDVERLRRHWTQQHIKSCSLIGCHF